MSENNNNNENGREPKNHVFMLIMIVLVIIFFMKFVFPAMHLDTRTPSSMLTGEEYESE